MGAKTRTPGANRCEAYRAALSANHDAGVAHHTLPVAVNIS
jgi:hypothetical protein